MKAIIGPILLMTVSTSAFSFSGNDKPSWILGNKYESKLSELPTKSKLSDSNTPWANSFWPHIYGGIAFRWNNFYQDKPDFADHHVKISGIKDRVLELKKSIFTESMDNNKRSEIINEIQELKREQHNLLVEKNRIHKEYFFDIQRPQSVTDIKNLTQGELDKLSPAEKYDVYKYLMSDSENYSTYLTNSVLRKTGPFRQYWEGICNGWTSASIEFKEPKPVTIKKKNLTLKFGSSDLKALISHYHDAMTSNGLMKVSRVGNKCNTDFAEETWFIKNGVEYYKTLRGNRVVTKKVPSECVDTNPGAFHLVISNMIGLRDEGFTAEAVRDGEVWNQPVYEYDSEYETTPMIRWNATRGTKKQVKVKMRMKYANDGGRMFWMNDGSDDEFYAWWNRTTGTSNYRFAYKDLEYYLDLDSNGNIIGGMWLSYDRPDFLWVKRGKGFVRGRNGVVTYMKNLESLVESH